MLTTTSVVSRADEIRLKLLFQKKEWKMSLMSPKKFTKKFILVLFGPTAVGKTNLALSLANYIDVEIINGDMGQLYTPLTIGTAKPDWQTSPVKHHLFDSVDKPEHYTVVKYRESVIELVHQIWSRGNIPLIVGGSGFYIKSLFFPPLLASTRDDLTKKIPDEQLWEMLHQIDPVRANSINPQDSYRLRRALTIWMDTGKPPSTYVPTFSPPGEFYFSMLTRSKEDLYARINQRVTEMINCGWIDEVTTLRNTPWILVRR